MKKLAVHLHLYYVEQLDDILKKLKNLRWVDYDLFVTMVDDDKEIEERILNLCSRAKIFVVENRGYDVGPFIYFLHQINLDDYEYVLKLHTKGKKDSAGTLINGRRIGNSLWGDIMWDSMLFSRDRVWQNLKRFYDDWRIGMIGSVYCFTKDRRHYYHLLDDINLAMEKMKFERVENLSFIAGCMFLCRARLLEPLKVFKLDDFDVTNGKIKDETLAHVIERLFGAIVLAQGYKVVGIKHNSYIFSFLWLVLKRFVFQKKVTKSGKVLVKICRIPVFVKCMEV